MKSPCAAAAPKVSAKGHALSPIRATLGAALLSIAVAGTSQAAFELSNGGAYATALGGALSAGVGSAEAIWFNPASSARLSTPRATSTYGRLFAQLEDSPTVHAGSVAWPQQWGALQAGYQALRLDPWSETSIVFGAARVLHPRVALGTEFRFNAWSSGRFGNESLLGGVGVLYEVGWVTSTTYMRLSAAVANMGGLQGSAAGGRATGRPARTATAGAQFIVKGSKVALDVGRRDGAWEVRTGYEVDARLGLMFRAGASAHIDDTVNRTWHLGIGYEWAKYHFDYAFSHSVDLASFGATHRFGVGRFF
tara:strand:+ start:3307 stop:4230 length:924 start_codon:yes stop_codon:yes gene_type:complete